MSRCQRDYLEQSFYKSLTLLESEKRNRWRWVRSLLGRTVDRVRRQSEGGNMGEG